MKPHLPLNLRKDLLAIYTAAIGMALTSTSTTAALTPTQTIGQGNQVTISTTEDYQFNNKLISSLMEEYSIHKASRELSLLAQARKAYWN